MPPGNRPKEVHTKHLTELERFRVRTLYYDAGMSKKRIEEVTGYSNSQIRTAIRAKSAAIPHRTGRPRKQRFGQLPADQHQQAEDEAGPSSQSQGSVVKGDSGAVAPPDGSSHGFPSSSSLVPTNTADTLQARSQQHQHFPRVSSASTASAPASFNRLPPHLRRYIWTLVLTHPPRSPVPLSVTWWVEPLPRSPWLVAGVFPDPSSSPSHHHHNHNHHQQQQHQHWAAPHTQQPHPHPQPQQQPHSSSYYSQQRWKAYVAYRQAPARLLCAVSREARRAVVDTFAAVWCRRSEGTTATTTNTTITTATAAALPFVWIDPRRDEVYCEDPSAAADLPALLDRSRAAVLPSHFFLQGAGPPSILPPPPPPPTTTTTTAASSGGSGGVSSFVRNGR
ncbi:hypothetical protein F4820DRAFT_442094 [Hypoxylon rubiginosum]|uniref:Uncharacterized protein n=1 Tax=Hypoxylon rubiginosum TaxID=110542 RepID=A0ACB9YI38_9PEZI|nr:hypothetical protein F4820DRAFT_442094 [Hypoxylon rubiginosum]